MKKCSKCEIDKEDSEFWIRKNRNSGLSSECKVCASLRRRSRDKEKVNKAHKEWLEKNPGYASKAAAIYQKKNKEKVNEYHREWYQKNKDKFKEQRRKQRPRINEWAKVYTKKEEVRFKLRANVKLNTALSKGKIIRPECCQFCSFKGKLEGHHADYSKPLEVIWLCVPCHKALHKRLKEEVKNGSKRIT